MIMIVCDKTYPLQKVTSITKSKKGIPKYLPRPIHLYSIKFYVCLVTELLTNQPQHLVQNIVTVSGPLLRQKHITRLPGVKS